jgi:hypothetical protein
MRVSVLVGKALILGEGSGLLFSFDLKALDRPKAQVLEDLL